MEMICLGKSELLHSIASGRFMKLKMLQLVHVLKVCLHKVLTDLCGIATITYKMPSF